MKVSSRDIAVGLGLVFLFRGLIVGAAMLALPGVAPNVSGAAQMSGAKVALPAPGGGPAADALSKTGEQISKGESCGPPPPEEITLRPVRAACFPAAGAPRPATPVTGSESGSTLAQRDDPNAELYRCEPAERLIAGVGVLSTGRPDFETEVVTACEPGQSLWLNAGGRLVCRQPGRGSAMTADMLLGGPQTDFRLAAIAGVSPRTCLAPGRTRTTARILRAGLNEDDLPLPDGLGGVRAALPAN